MKPETIIDYGERIFLLLLTAPFLLAFTVYLPTHSYALALAVSETLAVTLILFRKRGEMVAKPYPLAIAFLGTALPLLAKPGGAEMLPILVTSTLMLGGLAISISAKLFLNRSFGIVAANRGVKRGGPYRFVRHPMYLGYFITQVGFLLSAFTWWLFALYLASWLVQILRIIEEERILTLNEQYRAYALAVPRRVLPGF
jgi:protein-S-isoprenylcysteine O-methyltransferase Ste14